jgi:hypothetical protein
MTTGCGSLLNLTGLSTLANPQVRTASVMGGVQTDSYYLEHPPRRGHPCDPLAVFLDLFFSIAADVALLPLTLPIAAIVGDGPFKPEDPASQNEGKSPKDKPERSSRSGGKPTH